MSKKEKRRNSISREIMQQALNDRRYLSGGVPGEPAFPGYSAPEPVWNLPGVTVEQRGPTPQFGATWSRPAFGGTVSLSGMAQRMPGGRPDIDLRAKYTLGGDAAAEAVSSAPVEEEEE